MIRQLMIMTTLLALCAGLGSIAKAAEFSCRERLLIDYAQVLERMPADHLPGETLPFAPRDVELRSGRSVVVAGEPISYTLALKRPIAGDGRVVRPARLGWAVSMSLESVNRRGQPIALVRERHWRVGVLRYPERQLGVHAAPGLYRVSVRIQKLGGPTLASYRQYLRVLPRRQNLRIGISDGSSLHAGETVVARIENRGTLGALLPVGSGLAVERLQGEVWTKVEADEPPSVMFEDPEFLAGGRASGCSFYTIPAGSEPGEYRFSAVVEAGHSKPRLIVGQFAVS